MGIRTDAEIYVIIERLLKKAGDKPQTCNDIFDNPDVKEYAEDANRVSDYLSHMWRRGVLQRWYAPKDSKHRSRYAYTWLETPPEESKVVELITPTQPKVVKPNVTITESDGRIVLDFKEFTITVERK